MKTLMITLCMTLLAACGSGTTSRVQSGDSAPTNNAGSANAAVLASVLGQKTLACWQRGGDKSALVFSAQSDGSKISVAGTFAGVEALSDVSQVASGDTLMIQASGPDSDEGQVVILIGTYYLAGQGADGPTDAEAMVYAEIGPGDGSGSVAKLSCELR